MTSRSPKTKSRAVLSRRGFLHATALTGVAAAIGPRAARAAGGKVVVGTWGGDYQNLIQKNIAAPLLQPQGIEVIYDTGNDSPRKTKMMAEKMLPRGTMDISALNRAGSYEMYKAGTLLEIDASKIPNAKHVLPKFATSWSVPHIFSGRIILYNPKFVTEKPTSYADLWNPKYAGRVGIIDIQYQTTIQSAAMISGGSFTNYEPGKAKLMELKKIGYKMMPTNEAMAQALKTEEVWMCIMWKARGVMWQNAGVPVEIAAPKEGVVTYISDFTIPKNAPNKDGAYAFLNAMLDPKPQEGFIEDMGYNPTVDDVELASAMAKRVGFTAEEQKLLLVEDSDYLAQNDAQLKEWWDKEFKT
ncbi:MAG TPA: extracellular solute-binding protein [Stellaceae bacterium]|nr:extracellular solute-binding protein [Stellaceae bacterium]